MIAEVDLQELGISSADPIINEIITNEIGSFFGLNLDEVIKNKWDKYLQTFISLSIEDILDETLDALEFYVNEGKYVIAINRVVKYKDIPIENLAKLIDDGNLEIKGTKIISNAFNFIEDTLFDTLYTLFGE